MVTGRTAVPGYINGARRADAGSEAIVVAVHSGKCGFPDAPSGGAGRGGAGRAGPRPVILIPASFRENR